MSLYNTVQMFIALLIVGIIFLAIEFFFRLCLIEANKDEDALNNLLFYSNTLIKRPNSKFHFRFYTKDANLWAAADIKLNNMGYFSHYDYTYQKPNNEFRIVILGGEQTASSVVNESWPDMLKNILNERGFFSKKINVINLAWPDAGPEHYLESWTNEGVKFNADLVLINIVETDYVRYRKGARLAYNGIEIGEKNRLKVILLQHKNTKIYTVGHSFDLKKVRLQDSEVITSRPFGVFAPREYMINRKLVQKLQRQLAINFTKGGFPTFGTLSKCLLNKDFWLNAYSDIIENRGNLRKVMVNIARKNFPEYIGMFTRNYSVISTPSQGENYGDRIINQLQKIPNVLFIHSFNGSELKEKTEFTYSNAVMKNNPDINIIDMRQRLPQNLNLDVLLEQWYMRPHMGEKWTIEGHKMYAGLVADLIIERIGSIQPTSHSKKTQAHEITI